MNTTQTRGTTMERFSELFANAYCRIYSENVWKEIEAKSRAFDTMLHNNEDFKALVCEFARFRQDAVSSDKEAAAFMDAVAAGIKDGIFNGGC